jgi:hypothetical protein
MIETCSDHIRNLLVTLDVKCSRTRLGYSRKYMYSHQATKTRRSVADGEIVSADFDFICK